MERHGFANQRSFAGWGLLALTALVVVTLMAVAWTAGSQVSALGEPDVRQLRFRVTAYCVDGTTASGEETRPGVAAADPSVLPLGSVVEIDSFEGRLSRYNGIYEILDTGKKVRGRTLDLFMPNCREARRFGRRTTRVTILEMADQT
jgi:3D (Asp-Asp-Asp) domain-containing protein